LIEVARAARRRGMVVAVLLRVHRWFAFAIVTLFPAIAAAQPTTGFDPIDATGWPIGLSFDDLRELPECGPQGLSHVPGAPVTCRPPVKAGAVPVGARL